MASSSGSSSSLSGGSEESGAIFYGVEPLRPSLRSIVLISVAHHERERDTQVLKANICPHLSFRQIANNIISLWRIIVLSLVWIMWLFVSAQW